MKKIFLFLFAIALFSCAGEVYQEEITVKEGLAYKKDSNSLYSGVAVSYTHLTLPTICSV